MKEKLDVLRRSLVANRSLEDILEMIVQCLEEVNDRLGNLENRLEKLSAGVHGTAPATLRNDLDLFEREWSSLIHRITFRNGACWNGDEAIFFMVTLQDAAAKQTVLRGNTQFVTDAIRKFVDESITPCYFNFRSKSEQEKLNDPDWEK